MESQGNNKEQRTASQWSQTLGRDTKDTRTILGTREFGCGIYTMRERKGRSRTREQGLVGDYHGEHGT